MTDGEPVDLVPIVRKLFLTHHPYIPLGGEAQQSPSAYVKLTGRISPEELATLIKALTYDAQESDAGGNPEPAPGTS